MLFLLSGVLGGCWASHERELGQPGEADEYTGRVDPGTVIGEAVAVQPARPGQASAMQVGGVPDIAVTEPVVESPVVEWITVTVEVLIGRDWPAPFDVMTHGANGRYLETVQTDEDGFVTLEVPAGGMLTVPVPALRYSHDDFALTTISGLQDGDAIPIGFAGEPTLLFGELPTTRISVEPFETAASYFVQSSCGAGSSMGEPIDVTWLWNCTNVDRTLDVVGYARDDG